MKFPVVNSCVWPRARPRCRPCRASPGASLSIAAGALIVAFPPAARPTFCALDGSMAVGAAGPTVRRREPSGREHQYRDRGGRARAPRRLHALLVDLANAINATLYDKLNFNFIRDIAPVAGIVRSPYVMVVNHRFRPRRFPSSSPMPRPIPVRSTWHRRQRHHEPHVAGELFKMMTGINMVHVPYRGARRR